MEISHFCDTSWHDGIKTPADFVIKAGQNRSFSCCADHLGRAVLHVKYAKKSKIPINFRVTALNSQMDIERVKRVINAS